MSATALSASFRVTRLHFEHWRDRPVVGAEQVAPRLSWTFEDAPLGFVQKGFEIELYEDDDAKSGARLPRQSDEEPTIGKPAHTIRLESNDNVLVPWPFPAPLTSRQRISVRVRAWSEAGHTTAWSQLASYEMGILERSAWVAQRIAAPWESQKDKPLPEVLFRKRFQLDVGARLMTRARLYITAQGLYEAEIDGQRVGDHFLAPGWTVYDKRLRYQSYDVTEALTGHDNSSSSPPLATNHEHVLGVRLAPGWFSGRMGFDGGVRGIWGLTPALLAQLELTYSDGTVETVVTDGTWQAIPGPITMAEIYDGERYDARKEVPGWSGAAMKTPEKANEESEWTPAQQLEPLPESIELVAGSSEPTRRLETIAPVTTITTPSGKTILDFGQNLVGYTRMRGVRGPKGTQLVLFHAEVLENGELGRRPLRTAENMDIYTFRGDSTPAGESWEPRFTFHGFRYVQVDGGAGLARAETDTETGTSATTTASADFDLSGCFEAVVTYTDMRPVGQFSCSDLAVEQLYHNATWSMKGNFVSIPTDCPQRDERLGWTGDVAIFAPAATMLYDCTGILSDWLVDVHAEQTKHGGVPPLVVPNTLEQHPWLNRVLPAALWGDVTVLAPWTLYQATSDVEVLRRQFHSMRNWLGAIPRNATGHTHLWQSSIPQFGDWLDPSAPPDQPGAGMTDALLVADAYLIHSLDLMAEIAQLVGSSALGADSSYYRAEAAAARAEFNAEYVAPSGRLVSDSQAAYALALVFDLLGTPEQGTRAAAQLVKLVRKNQFKIGTGFAGTPLVCEALVQAGHAQVAYAMLLNRACPSWLYPVTMGATTIWERWDSMLPDGSINPGEMTSFNHYALGSVIKTLVEHTAGLQCVEPGWRRFRVAPVLGGDLTHASTSLETPYGLASCSWRLVGFERTVQGPESIDTKTHSTSTQLRMDVVVPPNTTAEVVFPEGVKRAPEVMQSGTWSFLMPYTRTYEWPINPIGMFE